MTTEEYKEMVKTLVDCLEEYDKKVQKAKQELKEEWEITLQWFKEMDKQVYA